jgi:hypothetical protein
LLAVAALAWLGGMAQTPAPTPLDRARAAFIARQYDAAIVAAREALQTPALVNPAAVVLARAHLERFRLEDSREDLAHAREALATVRAAALQPRDEVAFFMAQGLLLYFDGCAAGCLSAAAEMFALALTRVPSGAHDDRDVIFEWWAGSLDRQAQFGPEADRPLLYRRLLAGADAELAAHQQTASASYWVAAAARGVGDFERAWGAAIAGWVRAREYGERGAHLRADLDRLVTQVLLPERARALAADADARPVLDRLLAEWDEIKKNYP